LIFHLIHLQKTAMTAEINCVRNNL